MKEPRSAKRAGSREESIRPGTSPEPAPAQAVFPRDGGESDGTDVVFRWEPATDSDGDTIADYHFELSARADMKWPLSMSFAKQIGRAHV